MLERNQLERYAQIAGVAVLVVGCFYVVSPFVASVLFAAVVCTTTWPVFVRIRRRVGDRPVVASLLMTTLLALVVIVPVALLAIALTDNVSALVDFASGLVKSGSPELPEWIRHLPVIGQWVDDYWHQVVESRDELRRLVERMIEPARTVLVAVGSVLGQGLVQLSLAVLICFFLYRDGDSLMWAVRKTALRLGGELGERIVQIIHNTVISVVFGIIGTALAQAAVSLIGFLIAGVPAALVLAIATFFLSMIPAGPPLVWIGATVWLVSEGQVAWAVFMVVWGMFAISGIDNVVRPILISRGADLPFLLVFIGVLGGLLAFGFIGIFIGPTLLALAFALLQHWINSETEPPRMHDPLDD
ncbi:MAG: AI-2E family transporter [Rhodocyclaceae bacterium]|jgi:predicted PurR-regulated permease PerM|nr:AI-2E family transporter [Rhodocyclaceae bacterium]MCE2979959.1 AI-2E family transporter [Betaproteobacteria bacterium]MCA3075653.1 AI-2E family transporter [Rhodocyclaceae bacterium]MCA3089457.1 AI-2E family transporter [Rhodocyclaceae bacterium]MCA3093018.1 AI-2E family transporter [Rhodocyclaceae bacterium]